MDQRHGSFSSMGGKADVSSSSTWCLLSFCISVIEPSIGLRIEGSITEIEGSIREMPMPILFSRSVAIRSPSIVLPQATLVYVPFATCFKVFLEHKRMRQKNPVFASSEKNVNRVHSISILPKDSHHVHMEQHGCTICRQTPRTLNIKVHQVLDAFKDDNCDFTLQIGPSKANKVAPKLESEIENENAIYTVLIVDLRSDC
jgi:hypothetical protein